MQNWLPEEEGTLTGSSCSLLSGPSLPDNTRCDHVKVVSEFYLFGKSCTLHYD